MKKVRYLMGAAGVAPAALGLMAQGPAATAATHTAKTTSTTAFRVKQGKTVYIHPDSGCVGSTHRQHTVYSSQKKNWLELGFWSTHHGDKTCIGTIYVHAGGSINWVAGNLFGRDGTYYCKSSSPTKGIEYGCHGSFYTPFSVFGYGSTNGGAGGGFLMHVGSKVG